MKHILLFIAFCFCFSLGWAQESASDLITKGLNAEKLGLDQRALDYYSQAVATDPQNPDAFILLGKLQMRRSHTSEAAESLHQALLISDTMSSALEHLLMCYIEMGDFEGHKSRHFNGVDELTAMCERALELNPQSANNMCSMALIYNYK
ncbi:MAG: tetratricopeptide repeat protein, partial [Bacteroidales bacterium]|nr:tetratricopeptide repeat protein [Bacteroidales bacterium]